MSNATDLFGGGGTPLEWVTGTTYAKGKVVLSPVDFCYYVRKVTGAGGTDPSSDGANWQVTGRAIKSVQRGVASAGSSVTISAVNPAKTELRWLGGVSMTSSVIDGVPAITLASSTSISISSWSGTSKVLGWELTEYY